jgi:hypothetical protein
MDVADGKVGEDISVLDVASWSGIEGVFKKKKGIKS